MPKKKLKKKFKKEQEHYELSGTTVRKVCWNKGGSKYSTYAGDIRKNPALKKWFENAKKKEKPKGSGLKEFFGLGKAKKES